jgi:hypothetical protein
MVGASRASVNQALGSLRRRGFLRADRAHRITVLDVDGLARRAST